VLAIVEGDHDRSCLLPSLDRLRAVEQKLAGVNAARAVLDAALPVRWARAEGTPADE